MDLYALAAVVGCLAILVGVVAGALLKTFSWTLDARNNRDEAVEKRHAAECALLDATILSLRSELATRREASNDGARAAEGLVGAAERIGGAPPGGDGDRLLWGPDGSAGPGSGGAAPPAAPS